MYKIRWYLKQDSFESKKFLESVQGLEFETREEARAAIRAMFLLTKYLPMIDDASIIDAKAWDLAPEGFHFDVFAPTGKQ